MSVIRELENTGSGPFIQAITLPYLPAPINYQNRDMQFKDEVETIPEVPLKPSQNINGHLRSIVFALYATRLILIEFSSLKS